MNKRLSIPERNRSPRSLPLDLARHAACGRRRSPATTSLLFSVLLFANSVAAAPPTPGAVRGTLPQKDRLEAPAETAPLKIEAPQPARPAGPGSSKTIHVEQFLIHGNTAINSEELIAEIEPFLGQDLTLADLYTVADVLTDYYRAKGYSLARVVVPAQRVQAGIVRLDVIEGQVNAILYEGNRRYTDEFLDPFFAKVKPGTVVSMQSLERELLLVNDLPGFSAKAVVQPGPVYGTSDLVLRSQEDLLQGRVAANNYGREDIGEWRIEGDITLNNPLRHGDRFTLTGIHSQANLLNYVSGDYSIALNGKGTRASASMSYFDYSVGEEFSDLDIDGTNFYTHLLISHPIQRSRRQNFLVGVGFSFNSAEEDTLGEHTKDDDLYLMDVSLLANWLHRRSAYTTARATVWSNFQDNSNNRDNEKLESKLEVEVDHLRALAPNWYVYARAIGVYSTDPLPDTEKFNLGGVGSVRGYPASQLRGDTGGQATLELRRQFRMKHRINANVQAFWDVGETNRTDAPPGIDSYGSLSSAGLGLTVSYADQYVVEIAGAVPISSDHADDGRDDGRGWVNISAYF